MTFSEVQRAEQLLIKGEAAMKPSEAGLKGPERLIKKKKKKKRLGDQPPETLHKA